MATKQVDQVGSSNGLMAKKKAMMNRGREGTHGEQAEQLQPGIVQKGALQMDVHTKARGCCLLLLRVGHSDTKGFRNISAILSPERHNGQDVHTQVEMITLKNQLQETFR